MIRIYRGVITFQWRGKTVAILTSHYLIHFDRMGMMVSRKWR